MQKLAQTIYQFLRSSGPQLHRGNIDLKTEFTTASEHIIKKLYENEGRIYYNVDKSCDKRTQVLLSHKTENFIFEILINKNLNTFVTVKKYSQISVTYGHDMFVSKNRYGYVYILSCDYGYKLGSTGSMKKRMMAFGAKLPFKIYFHSKIYCKDWKTHEKNLHELLKNCRLNGEWFNLTEKEFKIIDDYCVQNELLRKVIETKINDLQTILT